MVLGMPLLGTTTTHAFHNKIAILYRHIKKGHLTSQDIELLYQMKSSRSSTYQAMSVRIDMQIIDPPNSTTHSLIGLR
jgi:hypothetical protein